MNKEQFKKALKAIHAPLVSVIGSLEAKANDITRLALLTAEKNKQLEKMLYILKQTLDLDMTFEKAEKIMGTKLTDKEKQEIRNSVREDLQEFHKSFKEEK